MSEEQLLPFIDELNAPFWEGCREGVLRLQQCPQTKRLLFPPRPVNSWTPRLPSVWTEVSGRGQIWSVIEPNPPLMLNFAELAPYNAIVVALDEDPSLRMIGNLVSAPGRPVNEIAYEDIVIGSAVKVVFEKITEEFTLPRWTLA
ncbi:MAG: OB-fold domain-containing protein [Pseudomonadota bacterium]